MNVLLDHLDKIKSEFYDILNKIIEQADLDMQRIANIIQMKICDINDKVCKNSNKTTTNKTSLNHRYRDSKINILLLNN
jgi:predicted XRE-type DNA-binding protein